MLLGAVSGGEVEPFESSDDVRANIFRAIGAALGLAGSEDRPGKVMGARRIAGIGAIDGNPMPRAIAGTEH